MPKAMYEKKAKMKSSKRKMKKSSSGMMSKGSAKRHSYRT